MLRKKLWLLNFNKEMDMTSTRTKTFKLGIINNQNISLFIQIYFNTF